MRAARSLGERTVTELILQHQNPQQLSANLWAAVRARGCQFLGPGTVMIILMSCINFIPWTCFTVKLLMAFFVSGTWRCAQLSMEEHRPYSKDTQKILLS
jgi:hypothetical protein